MAAPMQRSIAMRLIRYCRIPSICHEMKINNYSLHKSFISSNRKYSSKLAGLQGNGFEFLQLAKHSTFTQHCWKCHTEINPEKNQYFCECGLIQPPIDERTLFQVVEIEEDFEIDTKRMTRNFYMLQSSLHPDKFAQKSEEEKQYSSEQSALLNKAYFTLLRPLSRGLYMLEQRGHSITEDDIHVENSFLMEIMEINEQLLEAETLPDVKKIKEENSEKLQELISQVSKAFKEDNTEDAKLLLAKLKYYSNIDDKAKEFEMKLTV